MFAHYTRAHKPRQCDVHSALPLGSHSHVDEMKLNSSMSLSQHPPEWGDSHRHTQLSTHSQIHPPVPAHTSRSFSHPPTPLSSMASQTHILHSLSSSLQGTLPGVFNLQPPGHMQLSMSMNAAQHEIINLLKTLWDLFSVITCYSVFNKTTLLPVWPRDAKRLYTPACIWENFQPPNILSTSKCFSSILGNEKHLLKHY